MRVSREFVIYIVGVAVFGAIYNPLKDMVRNDFTFLLIGLTYIVAVRFLAKRFSKQQNAGRGLDERDQR